MKREFTIGTMLTVAFAAGITAQQPDQDRPSSGQGSARSVTVIGCLASAGAGGGSQSTADPSSRGSETRSGQFILTNAMVTSGGSSGTGTTGTNAGAGVSSSGAGASTSSAGAGTGTPSSGTKTGSSSGSGNSYRLTGSSDNLQQYVNSRVEVTGTLQGSGNSGSPTGAGATGTGTGSRPGSTGSSTGSTGGTGTGAGTGAGASTGSATGSTSSSAMSERSGSDHAMPTLRVSSVKQVSGSCSGEGR